MDNAKYHCTFPDDVPVGRKKKEDYIAYCNSRHIVIESTDTIPILKMKMKAKLQEEKMMCELLAEAQGHRVLFTPPCHSDFQPIELLWAKLKGNIGRKYESNTTMAILKKRLDEEFQAAQGWNQSIEGMIYRTTMICKSFYDTLHNEEDDLNIATISDDDQSLESDSDEEEDILIAV